MNKIASDLDLGSMVFPLIKCSLPTGDIQMTNASPKFNIRNSVNECAQSLRKENAGKFHNYGIKDCIASIAATRQS
jgi:hypothetical protein